MKGSIAAVRAVVAIAFAASAQAGECPAPSDVADSDLLGLWQAEVDGSTRVTLTLSRHPEFAANVRGFVEREGARVAVAGDVDDGQLTLEESRDGVHITAVWLGDVVEGSCGREIRGTWKAEGAAAKMPFVLKKSRP